MCKDVAPMVDLSRQPLDLPGWDQRSVFGFDDQISTFYAQLRRNDSTSEPPDVWISPPDWPETGSLGQLTQWIAKATGCPVEDVDEAMARVLTPRRATG
jgi:hypothetical protein